MVDRKPLGSRDCCHALSEDIWLQIFEYSHGPRYCKSPRPCKPSRGPRIEELICNLSLVSKDFHRYCIIYAQRIPLVLYITSVDSKSLEWATEKAIKLEILSIDTFSIPIEKVDVLTNLLRACDTTIMHTLEFSCEISAQYIQRTNMGQEAMEERIGMEAMAMQRDLPVEQQRFHRMVRIQVDRMHLYERVTSALTKPGTTTPLKKLVIKIHMDQWFQPLFDLFEDSLEILELSITCRRDTDVHSDSYNDFLVPISEGIKKMTKLKYLKITADFPATIQIQSDSLETINTFWAASGFFVGGCICPKLSYFRCEHNLAGDYYNGIRPVVPFGEHDLEERRCLKFQAGERPFIGLYVPDSCIVRL